MTSPQEDAPASTKRQSSPDRESNNGSPPRDRARAPRRPDMGTGCALLCFHMPSRPTKKKKKQKQKQPGPLARLGPGGESARERADDDCCYYAAASQRVTFLASASLSTWWPSLPASLSADGGTDGAWRRQSPAGSGRAGARTMRALSSSFSHWRRSQASSSRVMPHGADHSDHQSFSFPSSPVSVSSCLSTPRISHGCNRE